MLTRPHNNSLTHNNGWHKTKHSPHVAVVVVVVAAVVAVADVVVEVAAVVANCGCC